MKRILNIAFIDVKLMFKDKMFAFWMIVFPMLFIFIFGNLYKNSAPGTRTKANLTVLNKDEGEWGDRLVDLIKSPDISLVLVKNEPEDYLRMLVIPKDFSHKIENKIPQSIRLTKKASASKQAASQTETKIFQSTIKLIARRILIEKSDDKIKTDAELPQLIYVNSKELNRPKDRIPRGFDHVIPGITVQFIMMMVLIYGGVVVMTDRNRGILVRVMGTPTSVAELFGGKFLGRLIMGLIQAFILLIAGKFFFNLNLGNELLAFLIVITFSVSIASLSIFIGSIFEKEEMIVGISVLLANFFAALGGCWWPIEVVPPTFKLIGKISPAYWAMDGFHQIIFFDKGFSDILINLLVILLFGVVATLLSIKFFKIKK